MQAVKYGSGLKLSIKILYIIILDLSRFCKRGRPCLTIIGGGLGQVTCGADGNAVGDLAWLVN